MLKSLTLAAGLAGALLTFPQAAQAKVNVYLGVGPGYYGGYGGYGPAECQGRLGRRHCYGYGGYDGFYPEARFYGSRRYHDYDDDYSYRVSCREARRIVRNRGYRDVVARDCQGSTYSFFASKRGKAYRIQVSARSGAIVSLRRI